MDFKDELAALRAQRIQAVNQLEFNKAREIDNQMEKLKREIKKLHKSDMYQTAQKTYEIERDAIIFDSESKYNESTRNLYEEKVKYQKKLKALKEQQALELQQLSDKYAKELELITLRQVPEAIILREQARTSAMIHNYDTADIKLKQCNEVTDQTYEKRQEEVHLHYAFLRDALIEKHKAQIQTSKQVYLKNIAFIEKKHEETANVMQKRLELRASTLKVPVDQNPLNLSQLVLTDDGQVKLTKKAASAPVSPLSYRYQQKRPASRQLTLSSMRSYRRSRNSNRK